MYSAPQMIWVKFLVCLFVILIAGVKLSKYGDVIAQKTGLGGLWIGVILMATATSLPELFTGISAVALVSGPNLAIGTAFGSNLFNLVIIALLDILYRQGSLLASVSSGEILTAGLSAVLIAFAAAAVLMGLEALDADLGRLSIFSIILVMLYLSAIWLLLRHERKQPQEIEERRYEKISLFQASLRYTISAVLVIAGGTWLAFIGREISEVTGWGTTFVGSLFLAAVTSAPEVVVSIAALRLGALDMAVSNMFGSNMFNMSIVLAGDDLFYKGGSLFGAVSMSHIVSGLVAILMTGTIILGLIHRPRKKAPSRVSWYTMVLIPLYVISFYILFVMG
jgi:cation:H+ antiporter